MSNSNFNLAMAGGKAALVNLTTALSGECPDDASNVDFVGYGSTATCHWGNGNAPTLNNAPQKSLARLDGGCRSLRDNASDFEKGSVSPRNSAATALTCDRWRLTESTALFYDGWELNAEADAQTGSITAVYLHGADIDEIIARADVSNATAPNAVVYYIHDHLGSVRALSNASGSGAVKNALIKRTGLMICPAWSQWIPLLTCALRRLLFVKRSKGKIQQNKKFVPIQKTE